LGRYTVGVLVQTNFGGVLQIGGAPIGKELGGHYLSRLTTEQDSPRDGSAMIVVATDAPLSSRNLKRLARRAMLGLAVTGGTSTNGSGDYVIAFSTAEELRVAAHAAGATPGERVLEGRRLRNEDVSPLFQAVKESTEEAIYNSLFMARSLAGKNGVRVEAIPLPKVLQLLKQHGMVSQDWILPNR
jgi:D-aminopeptidase